MRIQLTRNLNDYFFFIAGPIPRPVGYAAGARTVTAVVPYLGYARQDLRDYPGDPRSFQVVARWLGSLGLDRLVTLDLHTPELESALPMPTTLLKSEEVFLPHLKDLKTRKLVVVSPDAGGLKRAQNFALASNVPIALVAKDRPKKDVPKPLEVLGDVQGRSCLVVDDMATTGQTLTGAAETLHSAGAEEVYALFTHAVLAPGAKEHLLSSRLSKVITTDSLPLPSDKWVEVVSIVPLLAKTMVSLFKNSN